jgi:hypothetical protein
MRRIHRHGREQRINFFFTIRVDERLLLRVKIFQVQNAYVFLRQLGH